MFGIIFEIIGIILVLAFIGNILFILAFAIIGLLEESDERKLQDEKRKQRRKMTWLTTL